MRMTRNSVNRTTYECSGQVREKERPPLRGHGARANLAFVTQAGSEVVFR